MLKGMDLHQDKNVSSWDNVKKANIQVVINKATEGTYYTDKYLSYRNGECKRLGIPMGTYHFAGHQNVVDEVNAFVNYTKALDFQVMSWLDIEDVPSYSWKWTKQTAIDFVNKFDTLYKSKTGNEIGLYCSQSFYESYLKGNIRATMKLWIAHYGINNNPYPSQSWQYTDKGSIAGEAQNFDMSLFQENVLLSSVQSVKEVSKVKNLVVYNYGPDMHSAEILADYLSCPTISNSRKFDYSQVENVYAVGGAKEQYTSHLSKLISGKDRYDTNQSVLTFIKNGGK